MISTNDMRSGQTIMHEGRILQITEYDRVKPGKGPTFVKVRMKDVITGQTLDYTWRGEQKVEQAILKGRKHQYLYEQGGTYHFMDLETYEQVALPSRQIADIAKYLKDGMEVTVTYHENTPIKVEVPPFVELPVAQTDPGLKGDTATGGTKPATLESGAVIQVPLFINIGDVLRVDTRTGSYVTRV